MAAPLHNEISQRICEFAIGTSGSDLPDRAIHILRLSLLDWIAVALAGRNEPVSDIVRQMAAHDGGTPEANVLGLDHKLPAKAAALVNGTTSHALDYDDTHFVHIGHPSAVVVPVALAIAERSGSTPTEFAEAALIGVEAACRIGAWLGRKHYLEGFHQTATSGCFGATLAAARLLNLTIPQTRHALGLASTRASGLKSQFGTMGKPFNAGMAASNGVEVALLASAGFVSSPDGLEGPQGFAATHCAERDRGALDGLGGKFLFEDIQHKFHACCHGTHAALEALIEARNTHQLKPEEIEAVHITVNPSFLAVCNIAEPATGLQAKFSYRLTAALVLANRDTASLETFCDDICVDPQLIELRDRVVVDTDEAVPETAARICVGRSTGPSIAVTHDLCEPVSDAVRETKVRNKAASLLGRERADSLWQFITAENGLLGEMF